MPPSHGFSHLTARKRKGVKTGGTSRTPGGMAKKPPKVRPRGGTTDASFGNGRTFSRRPRAKGSTDASGGHGTIPVGKGPRTKGPHPIKPKRKAAVDYVMARRKKKGEAVTRAQARKIVKKNIRADKKNRAYRYDFAGDGAHKKDEDYGTPANNRARKKDGFKPVKKNRNNHGGGNGNKGTKGDRTTSADDAGNSQSGDSYGGPQSNGASSQLHTDRTKKKYKKVNGKWVRKH